MTMTKDDSTGQLNKQREENPSTQNTERRKLSDSK